MSPNNYFDWVNVLIYTITWFIFTSISSGTAVPSGIFLPCMIVGCGIGNLYGGIHVKIFNSDSELIDLETMSILGATAVLSGSTRMTYSLAVIMMETTQNVSLFLPIIFTLFSSYGVGTILINKSIYAGALRSKNIPVLGKSIPKQNKNLNAQ